MDDDDYGGCLSSLVIITFLLVFLIYLFFISAAVVVGIVMLIIFIVRWFMKKNDDGQESSDSEFIYVDDRLQEPVEEQHNDNNVSPNNRTALRIAQALVNLGCGGHYNNPLMEFHGFSCEGLRQHLIEYHLNQGNGFDPKNKREIEKAATFAVDNVQVNWNQQAINETQYLQSLGYNAKQLSQMLSKMGYTYDQRAAAFDELNLEIKWINVPL